MCSCNDLITAFLAIELSSLSFYILASYKKTSSYSIEGGVKYFVTGAVSSAFFLLGSSFLYGLTGSVCFSDFIALFERWMYCDHFPYDYYFGVGKSPVLMRFLWSFKMYFLRDYTMLEEDFYVEICLSLILFSLFIKLAAFPFHVWSLDVYEGSPTSSTFFFAVITKLIIFVFLIRLCYWTFFSFNDIWHYYFNWVGISSIFVGSFGGLKQRSLKTLLAYSSITHMGYSLTAFGACTVMAIQAILFYLIIYTLSGLSIWTILLSLRLRKKNKNKYSKEIGDLALLRKANPSMAFAFAITMFSIAGIPPLAGFFAKMSVFLAMMNVTYHVLAFLSLLFSVVSTFYYIRLIKILYFENLEVGKLYYPVSPNNANILSGLLFSLIFFFCNPNLLCAFNYKATMQLI